MALIQFIGVIEGIFSSLFLATPLLVSIANRRKSVKKHNAAVAAYREKSLGAVDAADENSAEDAEAAAETGSRTVASLASASTSNQHSGASWRPGR